METQHTENLNMLPDPFGIGQLRAAKISASIATQEMGASYLEPFSSGWVNPQWRAMRRRQFNAARDQYEKAKAIMEECRNG